MSKSILFIILVLPLVSGAQISFEKVETDLTHNFHSGAAVVSSDINGDTYDDLVRLNNGTELNVDLLGGDPKFISGYIERISNNPEWNLIAGDINNDGWTDIVTSGISDQVKVVTAIPYTGDFESVKLTDVPFFAQGSNLVDVDGDGWLDIFVCNDDALNRLYINKGDGTFERNDTLIDFATVPVSDNSGNYGSTWTDFDLDGDLDMYLSKCRLGVFEPTDPRRVNMLYINTDTGYTEGAASLGLASGAQSWSSDFADIDNDGDFDIIVINHDVPSELFVNDNGTYSDKAAEAGIDIQGVIIQSIFRDFDNDGFVDLLVSGSLPKLYHNNGGTFTEVDAPFLADFMSSFTLGDFNNDGFPDIYGTFNELYNTPSPSREDQLWLNAGNDNNYIRIKPLSAKGGDLVGTKLFLYGPWGVQIREIRAGESYGIAVSQIHTFGLGQSTGGDIDSLVVSWPDGIRDVFETVEINTTLVVEKGGCMTKVMDLDMGPFVNCGDDTFAIAAPPGLPGYLWSTGETTESILASKPGLYHVSVTNSSGCTVISAPVFIQPNSDTITGSIESDDDLSACAGESIRLTAPEGIAYLWSTGASTESIDVAESGEYNVTVTRTCLEAIPEPVLVNILDPSGYHVENDTVLVTGSGELFAEGDSVNWYVDEVASEIIATGNSFITPVVDTTTTYFARQYAYLPGFEDSVGMIDHLGGSLYSSDNFNGSLLFDAMEAFRLDSVLVITDYPGVREILLRDNSGTDIFSKQVQIDSGRNWVVLDAGIAAGDNYQLTTSDLQNIQTFGVIGPKLWRSEQFVQYPYIIDGVVEIKNSTIGMGRYYYFYNWHISIEPEVCIGEPNPVSVVVVDTTSGVFDRPFQDVQIYPNPSSTFIALRGIGQLADAGAPWQIYDAQARLVSNGRLDGESINVSKLAAGLYILKVELHAGPGIARFVVADRD